MSANAEVTSTVHIVSTQVTRNTLHWPSKPTHTFYKSGQCIIFTLQFTKCTLDSLHYTLYSLHCTLHTLNCILYTLHLTLYTLCSVSASKCTEDTSGCHYFPLVPVSWWHLLAQATVHSTVACVQYTVYTVQE